MMTTCPAFVISLTDATTRREHVNAMLDGKAPYQFVDAIPAAAVKGNEAAFCRSSDAYCPRAFRTLSETEIACTLSHRAALQAFLDSGRPFGLILEDDAEITEGNLQQIDAVLLGFQDFDILKIGGFGPSVGPGRLESIITGWTGARTAILAVLMPSNCAHAYIVSRRGAAKLIRSMLPIAEPFDTFLRNSYDHGCEICESAPWLAGLSHHAASSTIGGARDRPGEERRPARLIRSAMFRLRHNALKRIHNFRRFGLAYLSKSGFISLNAS